MRTDVIVIGAGQAGLAASRCLTERGVDHVVLDRGRIGERWRSERWDSLTMQTPRWQSRLPGWRYAGPEPDGFMTMAELIDYLERYATWIAAPVHAGVTVSRVAAGGDGFVVATDAGRWTARHVIIATGHCDVPVVPAFAAELPGDVHQVAATRYRNPAALPPGGVLVVGASASGVQIADELRRAGRDVTVAVGGHTRLPRRHLGRDIMWWLAAMGSLDETTADVRDLEAARRQPSMQLVGDPSGRSLDLRALRDDGVRLVGRAIGADGGVVRFADDLASTTAEADARAARIVARIDAFATSRRLAPDGPPASVVPVAPGPSPAGVSLADDRIATVIWATGFRRAYPWLAVPGVIDRGELRHVGGVTPAPGLYALGLRFQRRRNSSFLDGVGADARYIVDDIARQLGARAAA
jgi:putative flavoprotein involved in K+ transport